MNETIPLFESGPVTAKANAGLTGKTFVAVTSAADPVTGTLIGVSPATAAGKTFGVAVRDAAAGTNVQVETRPGVILPVTCSTAVSAGTEVEVATGGKAAPKATGNAVAVAVTSTGVGNVDLYVKLY